MSENKKKIDIKKVILVILIVSITIAVEVFFAFAYKKVDKNSSYVITRGGTYDINENKECITIKTNDEVELKLNGVTVECSNGPAINVIKAKEVKINVSGENTLNSNTTDTLDGAIYSKDDLVFTGDGTLNVNSNYDGIVSKDSLEIKSGTYKIKAGDDGIRGKDSVTISDGTFDITSGGAAIKSTYVDDDTKGIIKISGGKFTINSTNDGIHSKGKIDISDGTFNITAAEGIEATNVKLSGGNITINASDDGINATNKSSGYSVAVEITGGTITVNMGPGDTDGIDSNGDLTITGGTISVNAQSPFDFDDTLTFTGGKIIVNGEETTTIKNQVMGPPNDGNRGPGPGMR